MFLNLANPFFYADLKSVSMFYFGKAYKPLYSRKKLLRLLKLMTIHGESGGLWVGRGFGNDENCCKTYKGYPEKYLTNPEKSSISHLEKFENVRLVNRLG